MPTTLHFISSTLADVAAQRTYWKERWADPWTRMSPKLWCNSAQWTASPALPAAQLHWRYGIALEPGQHAFAARFKESNRLRMYVKVEYDTFAVQEQVTDPLRWFGSIEIELDDFQGSVLRALGGGDTVAYASGKNFMSCFGLEGLLDTAHVNFSMVGTSQGGVLKVNRAIPFNEDGLGNRSLVPGPDGVYVFHYQLQGAQTWSSDDIARYLLKYHSPKDFNGQTFLPFEIGGPAADALSKYDQPELPSQGKTVLELLNVLLSRQRLTSWTLVPEDAPGGRLVVTPFTLTGTEISLNSTQFPLWKIPANTTQYRLATEKDRGAQAAIKRSTADAADQVLVRGARRTSTATFSFADGTLAMGWKAALETAFEVGASGAADYAGLESGPQTYRNLQARGADRFKPVYQRFVLPADFNFLVGDGLSGNAVEPLTPTDADPTQASPLAPQDFRFTTELALLDGFSYQTLPPAATEPPPHRQAKSLVLYPWSFSTAQIPRYRQIDDLGNAAELPENVDAGDVWSASVRVDADDGALWINMEGECPQDFAYTDFTRLPADADPAILGKADFRRMVCTLTVEWSEYATAKYPASGVPGRDILRTLELDAGEAFRLDYLVQKTILGITPETGALIRSNDGGYFRDDRGQLLAIATAAYAWYSQTRRAIAFETKLLNSSLLIGCFITAIGDDTLEGDVHTEDINSVLTSIEIHSPSVEGEGNVQTAPPVVKYETAFGELDVLKLQPAPR